MTPPRRPRSAAPIRLAGTGLAAILLLACSAERQDPATVLPPPVGDPAGGLAGWESRPTGTTRDLAAVHFADAASGLAVGAAGTILRTADGGTSWRAAAGATTADLHGVHLVDPSTGLAVGEGGTILRTADGGASWARVPSGTTDRLRAIAFADPARGAIVGDGGTILATDDGGATWSAARAGTGARLAAVHFAGPVGYAAGEALLRSRDGGRSWTALASPSRGMLRDVAVVSAEVAYLVDDAGHVYRTTEAGERWSFFTPTSPGLTSVSAPDASTVYAVGERGTVMRSANGGSNWLPEPGGTNQPLLAVQATGPATAVAVGAGGVAVRRRP